MRIYPAIDLMDGKCVRLYKGDFEQKTEYSSDPVETALSFKKEGAEFLHIVDLDGAKHGSRKHADLINKIINKTNLKIQVGGGIRTLDNVKALIDNGADKVIIGSLAVNNSELTIKIASKINPEKITLGLDIVWKNNELQIATHGWTKTGNVSFYDLLNKYLQNNVTNLLCTDISLDGTLKGPNFELYKNLQKNFSTLKIFASGGVSTLDDIKQLKELNLFAVITGKAIYENKFTVREALQC